MELALNVLWVALPTAGLTLAAYVLVDARRTLAVVSAEVAADPRVLYVVRAGVRRERRRVVMQLLLLLAMAVVAFGRYRIDTGTRILIRNAAMAVVSLFVVRQSLADVVDRRHLSRSLRTEALAEVVRRDVLLNDPSDPDRTGPDQPPGRSGRPPS